MWCKLNVKDGLFKLLFYQKSIFAKTVDYPSASKQLRTCSPPTFDLSWKNSRRLFGKCLLLRLLNPQLVVLFQQKEKKNSKGLSVRAKKKKRCLDKVYAKSKWRVKTLHYGKRTSETKLNNLVVWVLLSSEVLFRLFLLIIFYFAVFYYSFSFQNIFTANW